MKIDYDPVRDLMYLSFSDPSIKASKTITIMPGVMADFDKNEKLIGIEVLDASKVAGHEIELELPQISSLAHTSAK